ncbi:hypothetical protein NAF17_16620 [Mucilaginibacter sp. RB4R14]|uniref:hypothetical protein n=1 Tax=Mucilaginibacter aurantiaciroseus TaxID=2949308 RepID=UPI00209068C1|nr:hypothetical protein [Mucilaginibacter aurantiaciroseus]MCO5937171.1 hypothetical protein [Mucilaginibacter aurantiaciroseus]
MIFIKPGHEQELYTFEDEVIPLQKGHNGQLVYRLIPAQNAFIKINRQLPCEVHLVTFNSKADFE